MNEELMTDAEKKEKEEFIIDDPKKALWAMQKINQANQDLAERKEVYNATVESAKRWYDKQKRECESTIDYMKYKLTEYMENRLKDNPKYKFKSPYGSISLGKKTTYEYDDQILLNEFSNDDSVIDKKINHTNLKKKIQTVNNQVINTETGEIIKGVKISTNQEMKFRINKGDLKNENE